MAISDGQRITPKLLLFGRGLDTLAPTRRLLVDVIWILFTLAVLIVLALALDSTPQSSVVFLSGFTGLLTLVAVIRYVRASKS